MKFAAFISIIVSVAVMFAACQGAVGPKGPQGPKGDTGSTGLDGADGADGAPGADAFQPLSLKAKSPFVVISDTTNEDNQTVAGAAQTIDIADYMRGSGERTYGTPESSQTTLTDQVFGATLDGSMLTITPKDPQPTTSPYSVETFSITVSDGGESSPITLVVSARRNRSPVATADVTPIVGNQAPSEAPAAVRACTANDEAGANQCYVDVTFTDDDSTTTDGEEKLSFTATSSDMSKVEVVSVDNAPTSATDDTPQALVARLVIKGIASTWGATAHVPVEVVVVATDAGGGTVRGKAQVSVDGAPTAQTLPNGQMSQTTPAYTFGPVTGFFKNPEGGDVTFEAANQKSSNENVATVAVAADGSTVTVTRVAKGTAEITVMASEPSADGGPAQTASATFTVTATN